VLHFTNKIPGIANFYGTFLPLRFGLVTELECIDQVNVLLCQYYTNPCRALTEAELDKDRWEDNLKVDVPYTKGFAFLLATDCLIRKSTKGRASLDDVALALLMQRRITYDIRQKNWIETLACYLESGLASQMLRNMLNGSLVILPNEIGAGRKLVRIEREEIETGFSLSDSGTVLKLVEGSRAAEAGIRLGDEILLQTPMYKLLENFQMNMEVKVKRGEEVFDLMYWPRSKRTVPCWEIQRV
jgi:predicted metalloprotease with PDZ domain